MTDIRPVAYVVGWLSAAFGASMFLPLIADLSAGHPDAWAFAVSAILTIVTGAMTAFACANSDRSHMKLQQSFLLATGIWAVLPVFGSLPFILGDNRIGFTDAFFEAMSALTTTGATVFTDLEGRAPGFLLWRGMLQWFGGLGIVVVAMVFLPTLKIGGMQIFKSDEYDTKGRMLPRAGEIAISLTAIYAVLTFLCFMAYVFSGLKPFDALVHSMTTMATGGMANYDASFGAFGPATQYVAIVFMALAGMPFIRYIQMTSGNFQPFLRDTQIHAFLLIILSVVACLALLRFTGETGAGIEITLREVVFNVTSIATGTGYASADYGLWGPLAVTAFFVLGLIGGCSGSTACSVKVFRYQLLFSAVSAEIKRLHSPNRVFKQRYEGRPVNDSVMDSVMAFFMMFFTTLAIAAIILLMLGLDPLTAISGAASAIANIGPGLGEQIGPSGNFADVPAAAKWVLAVVMLIGRLELLSVFVLLTPGFWRW